MLPGDNYLRNRLRPDGPVGSAGSFFEWLGAVRRVDDDDVLEAGGLEAFLYVKRVRMRLQICFVWVIIALPIVVTYAINDIGYGGQTMAGFAKISIANLVCSDGATCTKRKIFRLQCRQWAQVFGSWVSLYVAMRVVDAHDEDAVHLIQRAARDAPPHHYAVVVTGVVETDQPTAERLRNFFNASFGSGAVLRVVPVLAISAPLGGPAGAQCRNHPPGKHGRYVSHAENIRSYSHK